MSPGRFGLRTWFFLRQKTCLDQDIWQMCQKIRMTLEFMRYNIICDVSGSIGQ